MREVGLRELKQNPTAAVRAAANGERVVITDRGHAIARLVPATARPFEELREAGLVRAPRRAFAALPTPVDGLALSEVLHGLRSAERY